MRVRNACIALPGATEPFRGEVIVEDGIIAAVGTDLPASGEDVDANGLLVLPGAIDPHVHFFDPGYPARETFPTGSAAAAAGGVTTVIDMPDTSIPMATDGASILEKRDALSHASVVDFGLFGGISGLLCDDALEARIAEMAPLVCGIKTYATSGADFFPRVNNYQYSQILPLAKNHDVTILVHAEDWDFISHADADARSLGATGRAFYRSRPEAAETLSVLSVTELAAMAGAEMHIVHLGTARAAAIVAALANVTGETCPQYLEFDCEDLERIGAPLKITPTLKSPYQKALLWQMLADGRIDFVASDHAPGTVQEKSGDSIWDAYSGIPGGPIVFLYALSEGYLAGRLSLARLVEVTSSAAARRYRLDDRKGAIAAGHDADLVFVDPHATTRFDAAASPSLGKVSPWDGHEFRGRVVRTMLRGKTVYDAEHGVVGEAGTGRFVAPRRQDGPETGWKGVPRW